MIKCGIMSSLTRSKYRHPVTTLFTPSLLYHFFCSLPVSCDEFPDPFPDTPHNELLNWYRLDPIPIGTTRTFHLYSWTTYKCKCEVRLYITAVGRSVLVSHAGGKTNLWCSVKEPYIKLSFRNTVLNI